MILPQLLFTENGPLNATITPTGGAQVSGAATVTATIPITQVVTPDGGMKVSGAATVISSILVTYTVSGAGGAQVSGVADVQYAPVTVYAHVPTGGAQLGGEPTIAETFVNIYNIDDDIAVDPYPRGGLIFAGDPFIGESTRFFPTGGLLAGGGAVVQESINFKPAGGALIGGSASVSVVVAVAPAGGALIGGTSPVTLRVVFVPTGGLVAGGSAPNSSRQSLFVPSGGAQIGGTSLAYFLPSGFVATAENPLNLPFFGWAFNYDTSAPSRYKDVPASSIWTFNGVTYITTAAGIYALDAATDVSRPITASVTLATTDFAKSFDKKVPVVYVAAATPTRLRMRVTVNKLAPLYYVFNDDRAKGSKARGMRATTGKALIGRYWQFRFENVGGADFELDSVELNPAITDRHGA